MGHERAEHVGGLLFHEAVNITTNETKILAVMTWFEVYSGDSQHDMPPYVIVGGLTKGDPLYPGEAVSINDTVFKPYAESAYTVNKVNVTGDSQQQVMYYQQSSGLLMELYMSSESGYGPQKVIETNLVGDDTNPFVRIDTPTAGTVINTTGDLTVEWTGYDNETEIAYYLVY